MKTKYLLSALLLSAFSSNVVAASSNIVRDSTTLAQPDSIYAFMEPRMQKKHPWKAALETVGMNVGVLRIINIKLFRIS